MEVNIPTVVSAFGTTGSAIIGSSILASVLTSGSVVEGAAGAAATAASTGSTASTGFSASVVAMAVAGSAAAARMC